MANLAIKGHPTRGKEVIQLLEMLGGKFNGNLNGYNDDLYYYIAKDGLIYCSDIEYEELNCKYTIFTLEEFLEKFPYKIGDKVKSLKVNDIVGEIINARWDNNEEQIIYTVEWDDVIKSTLTYFVRGLRHYKEETMEEKEPEPKAPILSNRYDYAEGKCGYVIPDGYEFDYIKEGFQTEIILKPKKPTYPKDFDECCNILGIEDRENGYCGYEYELLGEFQKLYICRNTYWKIAGKQLGLGKPWKPDWNEETDKFTISNKCNKIYFNNTAWYSEVLAFPTSEMRDTFYENFNKEIEICKELL